MGNLIQRNRGKRGAPDVTRNLSTGKVTTTYRDPRKKGSLGLRVTKSHDSDGNIHVTESFNYGGGVTKKTRTKQGTSNKSSVFKAIVSGGRASGIRSKGAGNPEAQFLLLMVCGGLALAGLAIYFVLWAIWASLMWSVDHWYITAPMLALGLYLIRKYRN